MDFNYDLEQMKKAVESGVVSIPPEALTSFEAFDEWLAEGDPVQLTNILVLNNEEA